MDNEKKTEDILNALSGRVYGEVDRADRLHDLSTAIVFYAQRRGSVMLAGTADKFAAMLDNDISFYLKDKITFEETKLALDWGTRGEYGDSTGINPDRLFKHVRSYMDSEPRREALRRRKSDLTPTGTPPADGQDLFAKTVSFWNWACDQVREEWTRFRNGEFVPCTTYDVFKRHRFLTCYCWLRSVGLVADDDGTRSAERTAVRDAVKMFGEGTRAEAHAGAVMLEGYFRAALDTGFDLDGQLAETRRWPDNDKFDMKWFKLKC